MMIPTKAIFALTLTIVLASLTTTVNASSAHETSRAKLIKSLEAFEKNLVVLKKEIQEDKDFEQELAAEDPKDSKALNEAHKKARGIWFKLNEELTQGRLDIAQQKDLVSAEFMKMVAVEADHIPDSQLTAKRFNEAEKRKLIVSIDKLLELLDSEKEKVKKTVGFGAKVEKTKKKPKTKKTKKASKEENKEDGKPEKKEKKQKKEKKGKPEKKNSNEWKEGKVEKSKKSNKKEVKMGGKITKAVKRLSSQKKEEPAIFF